MKTNTTRIVLIRLVLLVAACLYFVVVFAQPVFSFQNPSLVSGTDKAVNAVYRFPSVATGVDALVKIDAISAGMSLKNIDRTQDGFQEAFQPEYRVNGTTNGYIDFTITFVTTNTNTAVAQPIVPATGLDIDGDHQGLLLLTEMNQIDMGGGSYSFNSTNSQLIVSNTGTAYTANNITGVLFGALVDTAAKEVMFTVTSSNVSSMKYRVGANNLMTNSSNRYASLYFKTFNYSTIFLALPAIENFRGNRKGQQVNLSWSVDRNGDWNQCDVERSADGKNFQPLAVFLNGEIAVSDYRYTDQSGTNATLYYRLKMKDDKGETRYSNILSFAAADAAPAVPLQVYPSVVRDHFTARVSSTGAAAASLQVVNYAGQTVYTSQLNLQAGENNISVNNFNKASGNYIVLIRTAGQSYTQKIVVQ